MSDREANLPETLASAFDMLADGVPSRSVEPAEFAPVAAGKAPFKTTVGPVKIERRALNGGVQYQYTFPNRRGASIVQHRYSYGGERGLWELAVLDKDGGLDYTTPITDDVIGGLSPHGVSALLDRIAALPAE